MGNGESGGASRIGGSPEGQSECRAQLRTAFKMRGIRNQLPRGRPNNIYHIWTKHGLPSAAAAHGKRRRSLRQQKAWLAQEIGYAPPSRQCPESC